MSERKLGRILKQAQVPVSEVPRIVSLDLKSYAVVHLMLSFTDQDVWRAHPSLKSFCVFYAGWYVKAQGHSWHRNNTHEGVYIYCTAGKGFYRCEGREFQVGPGDLLYCSPFTDHAYGADDRDPWTIYWIHVVGSEIAMYSSLLGFTNDRSVIHVGNRPRAVSMFETVFQFLKPPLGEAQMALLGAAGRLLLASMAVEDGKPASCETIAVGIQRVMESMETKVDAQASIDDWVKLFGGSRSHFQRQFKRVTGKTPYDYFLHLKIHKACSYLVGSSLRVGEIAFRLGFADPLYFSRLFHRFTGHSARDYRRYAHVDKILVQRE